MHFSFKIVKISLIQNPKPRAKKGGRKPDPPSSENVQIPGGRPGGWSGLELTDTLFEKKYDTKLITLTSIYHLKPRVSLDRFIKNQNADAQIALGIDTAVTLRITTFHRKKIVDDLSSLKIP